MREHLGIERWLVLGGSWGSTLGLAYAQAHPSVVTELVLFNVVTTSRAEVAWVVEGMGERFRAEWRRFRAAVPEAEAGDFVAAYHRRLMSPDPAIHGPAAEAWCRWESTHVRIAEDEPPDPRYEDPAFRLCFARLVTHVWRHAAWLEDGALVRRAARLADVPGVLVHGRRDVSAPLDVPRALATAWPGSELVVIDEEGHRGGAATLAALVAATTRFADP